MAEPSSTSSSEATARRRTAGWHPFAGVVLFVIVTVAVQLAAVRTRASYESHAGTVYRMQDALLETATETCVVVGDSRALRGIDPRIVEEAIGDDSTWRNLARNGLPPAGVELLVKRYTARHGAPDRVVYAMTPKLLTDETVFSDLFVRLFPLRTDEILAALAMPIERTTLYRWLAATALPVMRERAVLREVLDDRLGLATREVDPRVVDFTERLRATLADQRGYCPKTWGMTPEDLVAEAPLWSGMTFEVLPVHAEALDRLARFAAENDIELVFVTMPVPMQLDELREVSGFNGAYRDWMESFGKEHPSVSVDAAFPAYPPELFADVDHLREVGAERYSRELGTSLRERP